MAREKRPVPSAYEPAPQEEMTVVVVKFKGGPESMQKGFDAVNNAIAALGPVQPNNARVVVQRTPAQIQPPPAPQNGHVIDAEIEDPDADAQDPSSDAPDSAAPPAAPKPRKAYTFMSEFNLSPAGVPSLKDYCAGKNVQSDNDKFLVASAWVQTHGGANPFTGRHLFTAFRAMEWKTQLARFVSWYAQEQDEDHLRF
jgi:hypothetical protein